MKHTLEDLGEKEKLLYDDLCKSNRILPMIQNLTQRQVDILVSIRGKLTPEYKEDMRKWRVLRKGKHGGCLRLPMVAKKFFSSENT